MPAPRLYCLLRLIAVCQLLKLLLHLPKTRRIGWIKCLYMYEGTRKELLLQLTVRMTLPQSLSQEAFFLLQAKSQFKRRSTANNVEIVVPVPADVDSPKFKTTAGTCRYVPEEQCIIWTVRSFPGGKEFLMRAHFGLPSVLSEDTEGRPPIAVKFEIPYFTVSGIQVRRRVNVCFAPMLHWVCFRFDT